MKKIVFLLSVVLLLMTGCSVVTLSNVDVAKNVKTLLSEDTKLYNVYFDGYKYYVPRGMKFLNKEDYNAKLVDNLGNVYYLYVDAISFYHKTENTYEENQDSHFSRRLDYNKKTGYIQIDKKKDGYYLINFMFNYAKMEAMVKEDNLVFAVNNMSSILRSVKFNRKVLESLIGDNILSYKEESFSLFDTNTSQADFLDVVSKYEDEAYKKAVDEEQIELDSE